MANETPVRLVDSFEFDDAYPRSCDGCGADEAVEGVELTDCPQCGEFFCGRCCETIDDLFLGWCKWCA